ncbi:unnamed protein product [Lampetra planeri]
MLRRIRTENYSEEEKRVFLRLLAGESGLLDETSRGGGGAAAWHRLSRRYNAILAGRAASRDPWQLRALWKRLKLKARKDLVLFHKHGSTGDTSTSSSLSSPADATHLGGGVGGATNPLPPTSSSSSASPPSAFEPDPTSLRVWEMAPQCFSDLAVLGGGASGGAVAQCIVGGGLAGGAGWYQQEVGSVLLRPKAEPEDDLGYERAMSGVLGSAEASLLLSELPVISSVMSVGAGRAGESNVVGEASTGESVDLKGSHGGAGLSADGLSSPLHLLLDNDDDDDHDDDETTSRGVAMETSPSSDPPRIGKREQEEEEVEGQQQQEEEVEEGRRERFSPYEGDGKVASEGGRPETSDTAANVSRGRPEALCSPSGNNGNNNGNNAGNNAGGRGDGDDAGGDVMVVDSSPSASAASTLLSLAVAHPHPPLPPLATTTTTTTTAATAATPARTSGQNGTGGVVRGVRNPTLSQSVPPLTPSSALPQRRGVSGFRDGHLRNVAPFNHHQQQQQHQHQQQQQHQHRHQHQQQQPRNDKIIAAIMSRVRAQRHRDHPGLAFSRDARRFAANFSASPSSSSSSSAAGGAGVTAASAQLSVAPLASVGTASAGGGPSGAPAPDGDTPAFSAAPQRHAAAAAATLEFARREHVARMENLRLEREILEMKRDVWRLRRQSLQAGVEVYPLEGDDCDGL